MHRPFVWGIALLALALVLLFPPYFGMDRDSGGRSHASLGYHSAWAPPTARDAYRTLTGRDPAGVPPARLAAFEVRLNVMRLARNVVLVAALAGIAAFMSRRRPRPA